MLEDKDDDGPMSPVSGNIDRDVSEGEEDTNSGTLIIDATCSLGKIRYLQDISHLNEFSVRGMLRIRKSPVAGCNFPPIPIAGADV